VTPIGIRVLPPSAAERIAAGEVVERPASVVKELIENSLDAGARRIVVEVEGAGSRLIRVSDDGEGIAAQDLRLAFQRFATSKIHSAEDLQAIETYGFRGEALPSIAAVARVEMITRVRGAEAAKIVTVGGTQASLGPAGGPEGTTVTVRDLFFNTPARRQFLKSPARELAVIVETVEALALAAPEVAFLLRDAGREILWYAAESFAQRARRVLGADVAAQSLDLAARGQAVDLAGVLGTPQVAQRRRAQQWFLVNGRPVRSPLLARALAQAYHTLIPDDRHPAGVLAVRLPARGVDANVHPRKMEVRFIRDRLVFDDVVREVRRTLHGAALVHFAPTATPAAASSSGVSAARGPSGPSQDAAAVAARGHAEHGSASGISLFPSTRARWPVIRVIGQLDLTYILGEAGGDLVLVDQHAAHERVLFERLMAERAQDGAPAQGLVVPVVLDLGPSEAALLEELAPLLPALGYELERFGPTAVRLTAVPAIAAGRAPGELFRACLSDLAEDLGPHAGRTLAERLAIATACHTAVRSGDRLDDAMISALLDMLQRAEDPFTCFHGRPTMVRVRRADLERWFYRRA
jgi:DNA mismatch repair protein MutL